MHDTLQPEPPPATAAIAPEGGVPAEGVVPVVAAEAVVAETVAEPVVAADVALVPVESVDPLERRVEALEKRVDHLNNSPEFEERITSRVLERLPQASSRWYSKLNPFRSTSIPTPSGWIVYDLLSELRFLGTMIFDHRFSMSWTSRGVIAASLLLAFLAIYTPVLCITAIPIVGTIFATLIVLFCGGVIFKILHRESERYRTFLESKQS